MKTRVRRLLGCAPFVVTQGEYERVVGNNPSHFQGDPNRPVETVSWHEAQEFCRKLAELPKEKAAGAVYRLPTEAEWEYACRAGTTAHYGFADDPSPLERHAWWSKNSKGRTHAVGQLQPNAWGLFDMLGNVCERCADWHAADYYGESPANDPLGPDSGTTRVLRGGSWAHRLFRCAFRAYGDPDHGDRYYGFRVARTLPP